MLFLIFYLLEFIVISFIVSQFIINKFKIYKMKKLNLLSRAEMKNVMGGVISKDTFMEMCLAGEFNNPPIANDGSVEDEIILSITQSICEDAYNQMP